MERDRLNKPLNEQPNLLDCDFAPTPMTAEGRERAADEFQRRIVDSRSNIGDAKIWIDTLPEVPEEDKPRIDKIIYDALDRIKIRHQRKLPSEN